MPIFKYKAINTDKESVSGLVEAIDIDVAAELLQEKGFAVITIKKEEEGRMKQIDIFSRIKPKDLVIFSRQFAVMISANVAMVQSLRILVDQTDNLKLKMVISEIADEVDSGSRLSDSLSKRPKVFSHFYISVIKAGETSGRLEESLNYLADESEKDYDMMSKIKGAMIYPIFVLFGLSVVGAAMMIFVVPKLTNILTETGAELPFATRLLIGTSDFFQSFWWVLIILAASVFAG
ncbi:MAG: type II secretion system F family protein, partial [Patescibacteria group bacterium]